jgi:endoglucanase
MHQYPDSDGPGASATCVSATIGLERTKAATQWLKSNNKVRIIGEFAGGANSVCESAVTDMLTYMGLNTDVWLGAIWWGGGPWWGNYIYSMEAPSRSCYTAVLPLMLPLIFASCLALIFTPSLLNLYLHAKRDTKNLAYRIVKQLSLD